MERFDDRRTFIQRAAAGAAAAGIAARETASALAAAVDAERKGQDRSRPTQLFKGRLNDIIYTPVGSGDTPNYLITASGGGGNMDDKRKGTHRHMSDAHLAKYINKRNSGAMNGCQCMVIDGIVWRLQTVSFDESANMWTIMARVCESNEHARPKTGVPGPGAEGLAGNYVGCNCWCGSSCYKCTDGRYMCNTSYAAACL